MPSLRGGKLRGMLLGALFVLAFAFVPTCDATLYEDITRLALSDPAAYASMNKEFVRDSAIDVRDPGHATRLAERMATYGLSDTTTTNLIREQGDCAPDSLALGLRLLQNPDAEDWDDDEREQQSGDVRRQVVAFLRVNQHTVVPNTGVTSASLLAPVKVQGQRTTRTGMLS
jgi:hypothetical protein